MAAAVASVLELDLDDVPNFAAVEGDGWWRSFTDWLAARGWGVIVLEGHYRWAGLALTRGKSPRGTYNHLVVTRAGELVHDPHPSGAGLDGNPIDHWVLVPLDPGGWVVRTAEVRTCRGCGCTDDYGCAGGCWWLSADLCSECQPSPDREETPIP